VSVLAPGQEDECPHGLDARWCTICLHGVTRPQPVTVVATFLAMLEGQCPGCDLPIYVGQVLHKMSNGPVVHKGCE
jgi:hypothetical protein